MKNIKVIKSANLKNYCSFHIGAKADIYFPKTMKQLIYLINLFTKKNQKYIILGNGSNILFTENFRGKIISMLGFSHFFCENNVIFCESGVNLFKLNNFCAENGLAGLEFSYGIPGTFGGAVKMNAGAFGDEICNHIEGLVILKNGVVYEKNNFEYSYRKGPLEDDEILIYAKINVKNGKKEEILALQQEILKKRKDSQPYGCYSAGSVFKRNGDVVPSKLIDEWGLKGIRVGKACISEKHAGFIINEGEAASKDVLDLIQIVEKVAQNHGYNFEREIKIL